MTRERGGRPRTSLTCGEPAGTGPTTHPAAPLVVVRRRREEGRNIPTANQQPVASTEPTADAGPSVPRLGALGQVYVTLGAATRYAEQCGLRAEEARRELTTLLLEGRVLSQEGGRLRVRYRSRTTALDITAQVIHEPPLYVVVAAQARHHEPRPRAR